MNRWLAGIALALTMAVPLAWADRPHIDYDTQTKTATGVNASSGATLWTPASGNKFHLQGCLVSANNASITARFQVSGTDVIPPMALESTGLRVITAGGGLLYTSARDAVLTYTITGSGAWSVMCFGYESVE